jgi:hypothetical protein
VTKPLDPIVWQDGPFDSRCPYHKIATYDTNGGRLEIEVVVRPSAAATCPVRIAVYSSKSQAAERLTLLDPGDADAHLTEIDDRLRKIGLPPVLAAYCAGDVVTLIRREAVSIRATQQELDSRRRG